MRRKEANGAVASEMGSAELGIPMRERVALLRGVPAFAILVQL